MPVIFLAPKQGKAAPGMGWHFLPVSKRHLMMLGGSALCENVRQKSSSEYSWFDVVVESLSHVQFFVIPPARLPCSSLSISQSLLKLMSNELVMPSNHLIFCFSLLFLPSIFPSIRIFSNESALCVRSPKYWSFSFSSSPSHEYLGLISFRIHWFDHLAPLKSLLQHHSLKTSILQCSAFFIVQLSYLYVTTGKTIALTIYRPLWVKRCLCFLICYLAMSQMFFQGASCSLWWERVICYGSESRSSHLAWRIQLTPLKAHGKYSS